MISVDSYAETRAAQTQEDPRSINRYVAVGEATAAVKDALDTGLLTFAGAADVAGEPPEVQVKVVQRLKAQGVTKANPARTSRVSEAGGQKIIRTSFPNYPMRVSVMLTHGHPWPPPTAKSLIYYITLFLTICLCADLRFDCNLPYNNSVAWITLMHARASSDMEVFVVDSPVSARLLTVPEVARSLSLSSGEVRRLIRAGKLPAVRPSSTGSAVRVDERDLFAYILANKQHQEDPPKV